MPHCGIWCTISLSYKIGIELPAVHGKYYTTHFTARYYFLILRFMFFKLFDAVRYLDYPIWRDRLSVRTPEQYYPQDFTSSQFLWLGCRSSMSKFCLFITFGTKFFFFIYLKNVHYDYERSWLAHKNVLVVLSWR